MEHFVIFLPYKPIRNTFFSTKLQIFFVRLTCDRQLSTFSPYLDPIAPTGGHIQVLIPRPWRAAGPWRPLPRRRRHPPLQGVRHRFDRTAAIKCRHVLALKLLPLHAGSLPGHFAVEIKVPALVGDLHAHAEEPLEVVPQLLVVDRTKEVPPHGPNLQFERLDAPQAWQLHVRLCSLFCCGCCRRSHLSVPGGTNTALEEGWRLTLWGLQSFREVWSGFYEPGLQTNIRPRHVQADRPSFMWSNTHVP